MNKRIYKFWYLKHLPLLIGMVLSSLLVLGIVVFKAQGYKAPQPKKLLQQLTMIQLPPPEPPPEIVEPSPEQQAPTLPEPLALPEAEPVEQPSPQVDNAPAVGELALDADATAGSDGFGLTAHKGGRGLLGGGGAGSAVLWYGNQLKQQFEQDLQALLSDTPAMKAEYSVDFAIWVDSQGEISRAELTSSSGNSKIDLAIKNALVNLHSHLPKPPPETMPQPVSIRFTTRV